MMLRSLIQVIAKVAIVGVALSGSLHASTGCNRREPPKASETQVTAAEVTSVANPDPETDLEAFRATAKADIENLDSRFQRLELRATTRTTPSPEGRALLDEAKRRRELMMDRVLSLREEDWQAQRASLDREWDEVLTITDNAGAALGDRAD